MDASVADCGADRRSAWSRVGCGRPGAPLAAESAPARDVICLMEFRRNCDHLKLRRRRPGGRTDAICEPTGTPIGSTPSAAFHFAHPQLSVVAAAAAAHNCIDQTHEHRLSCHQPGERAEIQKLLYNSANCFFQLAKLGARTLARLPHTVRGHTHTHTHTHTHLVCTLKLVRLPTYNCQSAGRHSNSPHFALFY